MHGELNTVKESKKETRIIGLSWQPENLLIITVPILAFLGGKFGRKMAASGGLWRWGKM